MGQYIKHNDLSKEDKLEKEYKQFNKGEKWFLWILLPALGIAFLLLLYAGREYFKTR